jgi:UDP-N-acetylglucosamine 2-epimerase (non-hydrolysing)
VKIAAIFGTRPEAIKLAPIVLALQRSADLIPRVCVTGQHRQMLDQVLEVFDLVPDVDLDLMQPNQSLDAVAARAIEAIGHYLREDKPDLVLVQGDTTTTLAAAIASFYNRIPVAHVEAGLRTWNIHSPWPEEANRTLVSKLAAVHFAPTEWSRQNLLREGVAPEAVLVTGNTVIDALQIALEKVRKSPPLVEGLPSNLQPGSPAGSAGPRVVLITGHRRESFGGGFENICHAIAELARKFVDTHFVYPVHLNPNVREPVMRLLKRGEDNADGLQNVHLLEPLPYLPFVAMMERAALILTDSGGIQEEAPSLGKPVLLMRDTTERPEAQQAGTSLLVGTDQSEIVRAASLLLTDRNAYAQMAHQHNPYGDGHATERVISGCRALLGLE